MNLPQLQTHVNYVYSNSLFTAKIQLIIAKPDFKILLCITECNMHFSNFQKSFPIMENNIQRCFNEFRSQFALQLFAPWWMKVVPRIVWPRNPNGLENLNFIGLPSSKQYEEKRGFLNKEHSFFNVSMVYMPSSSEIKCCKKETMCGGFTSYSRQLRRNRRLARQRVNFLLRLIHVLSCLLATSPYFELKLW